MLHTRSRADYRARSGGFALTAANKGFDAAAPNYAALPKDLDGALDGACPIVAT